MSTDNLVIRRARLSDAPAAARVWLRSFAAAMPALDQVHSERAARAYFRRVLLPGHETWVATDEDALAGVLVLKGNLLSQLYLDPPWRGRGLGDRFMELAKSRRPEGLELWVFQANKPAQRFYERHGFVAVESTDGHRNEEHEPDIRYVWRRPRHGRQTK